MVMPVQFPTNEQAARYGPFVGSPSRAEEVSDASVLKAYGERENTRLVHMRELREVLGYREFAEVEAELCEWVDARAWTTGDGPKALFDAAVGWLRERRVLLPG